MTDLTAITTPFGLLDRETQEALKEHGGPWEFWPTCDGGWGIAPADPNAWFAQYTYRVKPAFTRLVQREHAAFLAERDREAS